MSQRAEVFRRDRHRCITCGSKNWLSLHHCFRKGEYFDKDRDGVWNLVILCQGCHDKIHFKGRQDLALYCKKVALKRYKGRNKKELNKIIKQLTIDVWR